MPQGPAVGVLRPWLRGVRARGCMQVDRHLNKLIANRDKIQAEIGSVEGEKARLNTELMQEVWSIEQSSTQALCGAPVHKRHTNIRECVPSRRRLVW